MQAYNMYLSIYITTVQKNKLPRVKIRGITAFGGTSLFTASLSPRI